MHSCIVFSQFHIKLRQGSRVTGGARCAERRRGSFVSLWSGGTPLPQLLDKGFNDLLFDFLQFLPHLFQKLLLHTVQV